MKEIEKYRDNTFENIKHVDENGVEYWFARDLQKAIEYTEWRNFEKVVEKAKTSCVNSEIPVNSQFVDINKSRDLGLGEVLIKDYKLSRYACYLIVQNADPRKEIVALGQTYFAIKTRQQELTENFDNLTEDEKRLSIRDSMED